MYNLRLSHEIPFDFITHQLPYNYSEHAYLCSCDVTDTHTTLNSIQHCKRTCCRTTPRLLINRTVTSFIRTGAASCWHLLERTRTSKYSYSSVC